MQSDPHARISIPRPFEPPALALGPVEAFVLSKIDGKRSISDLAVLVGLGRDELETILGRLTAMGAVVVDTIDGVDHLDFDDDRDSSRPTTPSSDDPFERFDRATSPGEAGPDVMRAAGASTQRRRT